MKVLILAAGYAVRLKSLASDTPKPLLKIGKKPIIDMILDKIDALKDKVEGVHVITNEKFFEKFADWFKAAERPFEIVLMNDGSCSNETRLGAIRDMEMAIVDGKIESDLLVVAGDNLFEFRLDDFLDFAKARSGKIVVAFHDIASLESAKRFGVAKLDDKFRVVDFEEKPQKPRATLISTGIYYFPKDKLGLISEYTKATSKSDAPGNYIKWLSEKGEVYGFVFKEDWYDIGDIHSYEEADNRYKKMEGNDR